MSDYSSSPEQAGSGAASSIEIPQNREAEEAVLGAILVNPEVYYDVAQFLSPDDFFLHRNRWIYEAFINLNDQRLPIDMLTVTEELEAQGRLNECGGPAYLTGLISTVPSSLHAEPTPAWWRDLPHGAACSKQPSRSPALHTRPIRP